MPNRFKCMQLQIIQKILCVPVMYKPKRKWENRSAHTHTAENFHIKEKSFFTLCGKLSKKKFFLSFLLFLLVFFYLKIFIMEEQFSSE